jgi:hypothetical protein
MIKYFLKNYLIEKLKKATFVKATDYDTFITAYAKDYKYRVCGFGATDNKGTRSKKLLCGYMLVQKADECKAALGDTAEFPDDGTAVCLTANGDTNICIGDYGGIKSFKTFKFLTFLICLN